MIYRGDARGCDFRFFEKKLGKKLPCMVVARLSYFGFYAEFVGLPPCKKAFAELFSKSDNASPASPDKSHFKVYGAVRGDSPSGSIFNQNVKSPAETESIMLFVFSALTPRIIISVEVT